MIPWSRTGLRPIQVFLRHPNTGSLRGSGEMNGMLLRADHPDMLVDALQYREWQPPFQACPWKVCSLGLLPTGASHSGGDSPGALSEAAFCRSL